MSKTASLYLRVSTNAQTTDGQRLELQKFCDRQGWKVGKIYEDSGFSGKNTERPELQKLLTDARAGKAGDVVVVYKIDRIARSTSDLLNILNDLRSAGVDFAASSQAIDTTTAMGKMVLTFLGAIAEFERETIVERVRTGLERAKADGVKLGRPRVGFDVAAAIAMKRDGKSWSELAKALGASVATIRRTVSPLLKNPMAQAA